MDDPLGILVWVALIGAWLAHHLWSRSAAERQGSKLCTRCGKQSAELDLDMSPEPPTMCGSCIRHTQRNYRAGAWFFISIGVLFGLMSPFIVVSELRRFGTAEAAGAAAILLLVTALTLAMGLGIRYVGRRER